MDPAVAPGSMPAPNNFRDGLGERRRSTDATGDPIELLCLNRDLTSIPSFEFALRERASRLAAFRHTYYGRVRSIDRLTDPASTLAVASDYTRGVRLSQLLTGGDRRPVTLDINASLHLIRQLVSAVAMLHESAHDVAHGAIGPERIIVTSNARIVIVEYVLGAALEQLHYTQERYWQELRIALPPSAEPARFDQRADVTQIGVVALSLVLGRLLTDDEYPSRIGEVLASAWAISPRGGLEPLPAGVRAWLGRALQIDPRQSFETALQARAELDKVLSGEDEEDVEQLAASAPEMSSSALDAAPAPEPQQPVHVTAPPVVYAHGTTRESEPTHDAAILEPRPVAEPEPPRVTAPPKPIVSHVQPTSLPVAPPAAPALQPLGADPDDAERELMTLTEPAERRRWTQIAAAATVLVAVAAGGALAARKYFATPVSAASTGTLTVSTNPPGALVLVDNESRGATPLSITLRPGSHVVELRGNGEPRTIPVVITAGAQTSQYIELPQGPATAATGQLQVRTDPPGAQISIDGIARGRSPLLIDALAPGEHAVMLESDLGTVKQVVSVEAATTASLVVPLGGMQGSAPVPGWVSLKAPVEVQILENNKLLGTSESDRLMVSAGRHQFELVNDVLGYHSTTVVQVPPGRVAPIKIDWPKGSASLNAAPWAEVWIDGAKIGETPLGNVSLPIGSHEVVFRHPDLGEQRYPVTVTLKGPARLSVDLRKKP